MGERGEVPRDDTDCHYHDPALLRTTPPHSKLTPNKSNNSLKHPYTRHQPTNGSTTTEPLTVSKLSKVERELHKYEEASHAPSKWLTITKWLICVLLSAAFTFCLVFSKVGFIYLGHDLGVNRSRKWHVGYVPEMIGDGDDLGSASPLEGTLVMLILMLVVPAFMTLVRALWCAGFSADRPWPTPAAFCAGALAAGLESLGLVIFVLGILPEVPLSVGVSLMNGVFLVHALCMLFQTLFRLPNANTRRRYCLSLTLALSVLLSIAGTVLAMVCYGCAGRVRSGPALWAVPISLLCLSVAWCSPLQRLQLLPRLTPRLQGLIDQVTSRCVQGEGAEPKQDLDTLVAAYPVLSARWKSSIFTSSLKLILIPGLTLILSSSTALTLDTQITQSSLTAGLTSINISNPLFPYFLITMVLSGAAYLLGWLACTMSMQRLAFALPLTIATPLAFIILLYIESCDVDLLAGTSGTAKCSLHLADLSLAVPSAAFLYLAQLLSTGYYVFQGQAFIMEKESQLFWLPGYSGAFLDQHLLLSRKTKQTDDTQGDRQMEAQASRVFICTTMYREAAHEMKQLLRSLGRINRAKQQSDRRFQAHIFFDNGVRHKRLTSFALQLVVTAGKTLGLRLKDCVKSETPYGLQLQWVLPTVIPGKRGMDFIIHLKDNLLVKNKKRWSQVMYMSYILDYYINKDEGATDTNTLLLTTDADVDFNPASVEALLDLITRDHKVGAVCARTFPLGSGPIVWYQIFDYAIGHWFQKAANHVLGTVLCCPGCFSVYRAEALRHVLPTYASAVTHASEFLTKDMGEDRWLCTLLVQSGWRLEYSAAADNYTFCPEDFDEFFKQRRRWLPSTLANLALLLVEWRTVYYFNNNISLLFLLYQAALLFSTLISPAVCMLVMTGGVYYAWGISQYVTMTLLYFASCGYVIICLLTSPGMQLKIAKVLTVLGAFVMAAVTVGTIVQIVDDGNGVSINVTTLLPTAFTPSDVSLPISVSGLYLLIVVMVFVTAALLHLPEAYCFLHGIWYLWCLPAGCIILLTYSIVNLTDRSWGTREAQVKNTPDTTVGRGILDKLLNAINCCQTRNGHRDVTSLDAPSDVIGSEPEGDAQETGAGGGKTRNQPESTGHKPSRKGKSTHLHTEHATSFRFHYKEAGHRDSRVSEWLPGNLRTQYAGILETAGYDDTSFLVGMTDADLFTLGVKVKAHRQALLAEIGTLGDPEMEPFVPETIEEWLTFIGLPEYGPNFRRMHIVTGRQLEILKGMSLDDICQEVGISKQGHLKRLLLAIKKLRYPTESEMLQGQVKAGLELLPTGRLKDAEHSFWDTLRLNKLLPTSSAFSDDHQLKESLSGLRNSALVVFGVANTLWVILVLTLVPHGQLNVFGTNALGLSFLVIFGFILVIQFSCMLVHRVSTFVHMVARAPPRCGDPYHINWSWADANLANPKSVRRRTHIFEETLADAELGPAGNQRNGDQDQSMSVDATLTEDIDHESGL